MNHSTADGWSFPNSLVHRPHAPGASPRFVLCRGVGHGQHAKTALDAAQVAAGIAEYSLMRISSVLPPGARATRSLALPAGSYLPLNYCTHTSCKPGELISAAIAVGVPSDADAAGVIMEYAATCSAIEAEHLVREMAREAMETRGLDVERIESVVVEAFATEGPTCVFAGVALVPGPDRS